MSILNMAHPSPILTVAHMKHNMPHLGFPYFVLVDQIGMTWSLRSHAGVSQEESRAQGRTARPSPEQLAGEDIDQVSRREDKVILWPHARLTH